MSMVVRIWLWPSSSMTHSKVGQTAPHRIAENFAVEFELSADDLKAIDPLNTGKSGGPELDADALEAFGFTIPEA
jgi:diketogulonate reductase-like aldo/keto reductase